MSCGDDGKGIDPKQASTSRADPAESGDPAGWLDALNRFLDRALKADIDTGC